jgi:hypothetical protein
MVRTFIIIIIIIIVIYPFSLIKFLTSYFLHNLFLI